MPAQQNNSSATATGAGDGEKPRRVRTSKPKVKTGCTNCKLRRIKCDERRPECSNCVRSKKACGGYPPPPRARGAQDIRIAPKPAVNIAIAPVAAATTPVSPAASNALIARSTPTLPRTAVHMLRTPPQTPINIIANAFNIGRLPASDLQFNPLQGQYFQVFQEHTASELSGFFDSGFWTRNVLQECHSEETIRNAVIALGALYKTLEKMTESPPSSPAAQMDLADNVHRHFQVAFRHYDAAIKGVRSLSSESQSSQRTSLMAHVLLACFDSFIGDHKFAITQIQEGLKLLERLRAERRKSFLPKPEEPVEQELIQMFSRLAIQAKSYDMAFHFPQPYVIRLTPQPSDNPTSPSSEGGSPVSTNHEPIPETFTSLLEARTAWDTIVEKMLRFTETMFQYTSGTNPMGILPTTLKQYGIGFKAEIEAWIKAFEPILNSRTAPGINSQEKTGIAALKMTQIMCHILFLMTFSDSEMAFDQFLPYFKVIVNLAMEVVGDEERRAASRRCPDPHFCPHQHQHQHQHLHEGEDIFGGAYTARHIKPSFSADLGIVPPLFVVATKCRDPVLRRQAIQLLRSSARREGMWDSELSARIAMWIVAIEEEEDYEPAYPTYNNGPRPSISSSRSNGSIDFGDDELGPGGNARWDSRRESIATATSRPEKKIIPDSKRVLLTAVDFNLQNRTATLQCGTRGLTPGMPDLRTRATSFTW